MDVYAVEYTDTFGGEANYCWVRRATIEVVPMEPDTVYTSAATIARKRRAYQMDVMRKAKAAMGLTGTRGRTYDLGDGYEFRPYGECTVMFVQYVGDETSVGGFNNA